MGLLQSFREKVYEPIDMVVGTVTAVAVTAGYFGYADMKEQNATLIKDNAALQETVTTLEGTVETMSGKLDEVSAAILAFTDAAKERAGEAVDAATERGVEALENGTAAIEEFDADAAQEKLEEDAGGALDKLRGLGIPGFDNE